MSEAFKNAGFAMNDEPRGKGPESTREILNGMGNVSKLNPEPKENEKENSEIKKVAKLKELTEGQLEIIKGFVRMGAAEEALDKVAHGYGYPTWQAMKKDRKELR